jgi:hypothetical protein
MRDVQAAYRLHRRPLAAQLCAYRVECAVESAPRRLHSEFSRTRWGCQAAWAEPVHSTVPVWAPAAAVVTVRRCRQHVGRARAGDGACACGTPLLPRDQVWGNSTSHQCVLRPSGSSFLGRCVDHRPNVRGARKLHRVNESVVGPHNDELAIRPHSAGEKRRGGTGLERCRNGNGRKKRKEGD